ncbi:MAG: DNA-processing protein DprA [Candidatus Moranbacteria bacterium]|jgi:DNA processing protein|nr:DNA-processing protein DprA [Candidatus Moranbacteria bacterium]MDD5651851.1 DNA-processing protein DprA [Candidatus Moranbacteria bacterium]MDX9855337.1 DNA-processing protein DprA [Candidatus Moranbacteria bacterium]
MKYLNALNKISGIGHKKIKILSEYFKSGEKIWSSGKDELLKSGIDEKTALNIINERAKLDPDTEWNYLKKENIRVSSISDDEYPELLKEIPSAPYLIYKKGNLDFNTSPMVAIVGSRKMTSYGKQVAYSLSRDLAVSGITVVSGMALGIDAIAHRGALEAGGKTIAVLGSSLDDMNIGPRENFNLSRRIMENGVLVSDYPLPTPAAVGTFPSRNRIMAGMTLGTVVIEAAEKSGTLITASLALDFNREVFAVPGSIFSQTSMGANRLIRSGAKLVAGVSDILEELNLERKKMEKSAKKIIPESIEEKNIIDILSSEPTHIDRIIKLAKLKTSVASSTLAILEMKGMIRDIGGQNYILI